MIAANSSALSAFLKGEIGRDVELIVAALQNGNLRFPPVVVTEVLSDPVAGAVLEDLLPRIELLEIDEGYWQRAGLMRRQIKRKGLKAKTADALIAQSCIDHDVALITRDVDFRHFENHCGLKLA